eukprot:9395522-Pyramimonas_sp.AAC.1
MALMGSAGQPAESDFDSGTDTDASSDDEATALDYSDMPTYLTEEQRAQWSFLGYQKQRRRRRRSMEKPVRKVQRIARRALKGKGKGRNTCKGKLRRLYGRSRRQTSGKCKGCRGNPKDANGEIMECDICRSTQHFCRECPQGDGRGR